MPDADKPAVKTLVGIKGWLLLYIISGISGVLFGVKELMLSEIFIPPIILYLLGLHITSLLLGLYLIFAVRKAVTQTYHIWLNIIWASFMAFASATLLSWPTGWGSVIGLLIWAAYWIGSKRVRATYCSVLNDGHQA